jgi:outer membrane receptor protein involved in Fe transport
MGAPSVGTNWAKAPKPPGNWFATFGDIQPTLRKDEVPSATKRAACRTDLLRLQASFAAIRGEGPNPGGTVAFKTIRNNALRVPLSRVPPFNGTVEARVSLPRGVYAGAALRWALDQTRLAISDLTDYRIPIGGTPGFAVADLRAGARIGTAFVFNAQLENIFNTAYRTHGSGVNGPGRGFSFAIEGGF